MKIILTVEEANLETKLDPRFGRAAYYLIVDPETMQWEAQPNSAVTQQHGAGIAAAQWVSEQGVGAVISGDFGPNASSVLGSAGIQMFLFKTEQTAQEAISSYLNGSLQPFNT